MQARDRACFGGFREKIKGHLGIPKLDFPEREQTLGLYSGPSFSGMKTEQGMGWVEEPEGSGEYIPVLAWWFS